MESFEQYVRRRGPELIRFAAAVSADPVLAEDVVQSVFERVHRDWERISHMVAVDAYVRRAVVNETVSWRRRFGRLVLRAIPVDRPAPGDHSEEHAVRSDLAERVARLPARQRAAVVMRFWGDLPDDEIAAALGCRPVTVRGYISRALRSLRIEMSEEKSDA